MATLTLPSLATANGASTIQTSNFDIVAADYRETSYQSVTQFARNTEGGLPGVPKTYDATFVTWLMRSDMPAAQSHQANIIGFKVTQSKIGRTVFSTDSQKYVNIVLQATRVEVHNWFPTQLALSGGLILTQFVEGGFWITAIRDPESGAITFHSDHSKIVYESLAMCFSQVAANYPAADRIYKVVAGLMPI